MELRRNHTTTSVHTEGGLLPPDLLAKIAAAEPDVPGLTDADFALADGGPFREAITRSWNRLIGVWAALEAVRIAAEPTDPLTSPTRERFLLPLFEELGFGRLTVARAVEIDGATYPISHIWRDRVPVHLVGFGVELDARTKGVRGAAGAAPHALAQEYLNRSDDALWGLVANGRTLRLLRDSTSLTRQAFVEFDLEAIFTGELFADFAVLWTICHRSRFEGDRPTDCLLERWTKKAAEDGTRALDKLRGGVEKAIETLGAGFLANSANGALRDALRTGALDRQDYYRELLRFVYRLIFLFTAEDRRAEETGRELLLDPVAPDEAVNRFRRYYSTTRLRTLAGRRRGTRHPDLWAGLRRVMAALGADGAPSLALPALGSFLFAGEACPHLEQADLSNQDLLDGIRALATIEEDRRLRIVDYRNLGAEELGGIYEGLLELHPRIELEANPPRFALETAAGNERKATGSYYTPTSLINCLLDSALDPVVDEAVRGRSGQDAEAAILNLAIVDAAAGSGHFLIAAAHRVAKRLASIRSGEGEAPPAEIRHALRDVIAHCIYAVDRNPMAVELCKVSLWLEALEPGKPLSFLDAHIKCGNSLLGTTPAAASSGVPDGAFEVLDGDDRQVSRAWRERNRLERAGQQTLFEAPLAISTDLLTPMARDIELLPEDSKSAVATKAARHAAYLASRDHQRTRAALDAWCAAFVAVKLPDAPEITTAAVRMLNEDPTRVPATIRDSVASLAKTYAFFHWPLEFPAVFERGGFDVVIGNPPWDQVQLDDREFFAESAPSIASAQNMAKRKRLIAALKSDDPALYREYESAIRVVRGFQAIAHNGGAFPLASYGRLNLAPLFVELAMSVQAPKGMVGLVVPLGIATDSFNQHLFAAFVDGKRLASLFSFENEEKVFPGVHNEFKFCLLTLTGPSSLSQEADFVFFARQTSWLEDPERHFTLSADDFSLLNPNTRTCPTFRSRYDAELTKRVYRTAPILRREGEEAGPWAFQGLLMFMMNSDSARFHDTPGQGRVPLYEGKMIGQFDHRYGTYHGQTQAQANKGVLPQTTALEKSDPTFATVPQYWLDSGEVDVRLSGRWDRDWLIGWRDITNSVANRTFIASVIPRVGAGDNLPIALLGTDAAHAACLLGNFNSFVFDYVTRQKIGGSHLRFFVVHQLPVLPPSAYDGWATWDPSQRLGEWIVRRVVELQFTSTELRAFASDAGWTGGPFAWDATRREILRAELDAAYFHLYGITRPEIEHVMRSFWIVEDKDTKEFGCYRTRDLILEAYDALGAATHDRPFVSRLGPAPGLLSSADPVGAWRPWNAVTNA